MLNAADAPSNPLPSIIDYVNPVVAKHMAEGKMNTEEDRLLENIASAIRRGRPQMRTGPIQPQRICLVGSGPSLAETADELRQLLFEGAILVTMNGAYHWALERNLQPKTQIVMDARPTNARFVSPYVPHCRYVLASQCDPALWDTVADYPDVWIFHAVTKASEGKTAELLDRYYGGQWIGIGGGTTVASRAINLLRTAGYVRFDLFGVDCCWLNDQHHALPQPENDHDIQTRDKLTVHLRDSDASVTRHVSPWHLKQFEDFLTTMHVNGSHFQLHVHGSGLLAETMRILGSESVDNLVITKEDAGG